MKDSDKLHKSEKKQRDQKIKYVCLFVTDTAESVGNARGYKVLKSCYLEV